MEQGNENEQNIKIYEVGNKKYTVVTKSIENAEDTDRLYEVICKYIISQIKKNL